MEFMPEGPKAIPLWINGRAFLTMAPSFFEVVNPQTGTAQYQVPLCGADEAQEAVAAARAALPGWQEMSAADIIPPFSSRKVRKNDIVVFRP